MGCFYANVNESRLRDLRRKCATFAQKKHVFCTESAPILHRKVQLLRVSVRNHYSAFLRTVLRAFSVRFARV